MKLSQQAQGLLITTAGVLAISPDTLLVRLLELEKWSLLFYRGIIIATCLTLFTVCVHRRKAVQQFRSIGIPGLFVALLFTGSTTCFVISLYYTSVANTLIIVSASSMFAALYSRVFMKETVALRTIITMLVVIGAIGYIVQDGIGSGSLHGDLLATCSSMFMAGAFTLTRVSRSRNMIPASALSGLITATIAFFPATFVLLDLQTCVLLVTLGICLATAFGLLTVGPRYISAPEVSLLMPLETVLGPLLIWWVIGEQPGNTAITGGIVVVGALTIHSLLSLKRTARPIH
ncbi:MULTISPECIES: DMT family transporter [Desulfosediminicola]|uniref:DMT family transporter n=1 Tax=Desulfosediminicola TaxID=2886823 RepID=UPI00142F0DFC|nr:DMT family transporter [Desulfosediminicola ganghwensis]